MIMSATKNEYFVQINDLDDEETHEQEMQDIYEYLES